MIPQTPPAQQSTQERWQAVYGSAPPRSITLIEQALAWREQVLAHGDVGAPVQKELVRVAEQALAARAKCTLPAGDLPVRNDRSPSSGKLTAGTRLVKVYGGKTHVVEVTAGGMRYDGQVFASLSAVAKAITGTHWNGLLFFGLRKRGVYAKKAAAHG